MSNPGGKGSGARPFDVSHDVFSNNFERIFGKKPTKTLTESLTEKQNEAKPAETESSIS